MLMFYAVYDAVVSMAADAIAIAVLSVVLIIIAVVDAHCCVDVKCSC